VRSPRLAVLAFQAPDAGRERKAHSIPFSLVEYFELVDWTGRASRHDKRGSIDPLRRLRVSLRIQHGVAGNQVNSDFCPNAGAMPILPWCDDW
jgi:hypothetical protein